MKFSIHTLLDVKEDCSFNNDSPRIWPFVEKIFIDWSIESVTIERLCLVQSILIIRCVCSKSVENK